MNIREKVFLFIMFFCVLIHSNTVYAEEFLPPVVNFNMTANDIKQDGEDINFHASLDNGSVFHISECNIEINFAQEGNEYSIIPRGNITVQDPKEGTMEAYYDDENPQMLHVAITNFDSQEQCSFDFEATVDKEHMTENNGKSLSSVAISIELKDSNGELLTPVKNIVKQIPFYYPAAPVRKEKSTQASIEEPTEQETEEVLMVSVELVQVEMPEGGVAQEDSATHGSQSQDKENLVETAVRANENSVRFPGIWIYIIIILICLLSGVIVKLMIDASVRRKIKIRERERIFKKG